MLSHLQVCSFPRVWLAANKLTVCERERESMDSTNILTSSLRENTSIFGILSPMNRRHNSALFYCMQSGYSAVEGKHVTSTLVGTILILCIRVYFTFNLDISGSCCLSSEEIFSCFFFPNSVLLVCGPKKTIFCTLDQRESIRLKSTPPHLCLSYVFCFKQKYFLQENIIYLYNIYINKKNLYYFYNL